LYQDSDLDDGDGDFGEEWREKYYAEKYSDLVGDTDSSDLHKEGDTEGDGDSFPSHDKGRRNKTVHTVKSTSSSSAANQSIDAVVDAVEPEDNEYSEDRVLLDGIRSRQEARKRNREKADVENEE
jgi:hypothetical protein